jgi:diguanylate cyclase (GGDEF)-like protein
MHAATKPPEERASGELTVSSVEGALVANAQRLKFPPAIERQFETDTGAARRKHIVLTTLLGFSFYMLSLMSDLRLTPDVFGTAVLLKIGVVTPFALLTLVLVARTQSARLREATIPAIACVLVFVAIYLTRESESPFAAHAQYSALLGIIMPNLIVQARFWYALSGSLVIFAIYAGGIYGLPNFPFDAYAAAVMTMVVTVTCTLYVNAQLERDRRRAYLVALRDQIRGRQLLRANQELSRISNLDAMTGLTNRRGLDTYLETVWTEAKEMGLNVAVLMIDVDHFKRFNDRYGHQAGDDCLRQIGDIARGQLRRGDELAARFGGEEFVMVLPGADLLDAIRVAERTRRAIEAAEMRHEAAPAQVVTVSVGVAAAAATAAGSAADLIASADSALYEAKRRGRNRVWPPVMAAHPFAAAADTDVAAVA